MHLPDRAAAHPPRPKAQRIERLAPSLHRPDVSHVIFDFDGTVSWLRHGWPRIMLNGFLDHSPAEWRASPAVRDDILAELLSLNGKPTMHQMVAFAERLKTRAGNVVDPQQLFVEYETRLAAAIAERRATIPQVGQDTFAVCGVRHIIQQLQARGLTLIILSGTVETEVRDEAELLGVTTYFEPHIYGSVRGVAFSKGEVIDRILREEKIEGHDLLSFGDGPIEMKFTRAVGGFAIGVASNEDDNGSHMPDPFKREQLSRAGAHAIIPDYAEADVLLEEIFGQ